MAQVHITVENVTLNESAEPTSIGKIEIVIDANTIYDVAMQNPEGAKVCKEENSSIRTWIVNTALKAWEEMQKFERRKYLDRQHDEHVGRSRQGRQTGDYD